MKIWMSENIRQNNKYASRTVGFTLACVAVAMILTVGGTFLSLYKGWDMRSVSMVMCIGVTVLVVVLALRAGKAANRDALIFCRDDNDALFVVNATNYARGGRGMAGFARKAAETQKVLEVMRRDRFLEKYMSQEKSLHGLETEILSVEKLKTTASGYVAVCRVRFRNGNTGKQTFTISKGYEREAELIFELERRRAGAAHVT